MKFHIVALAHTQVRGPNDFESCAFTQKVRKFASMMAKRGHDVVLYAPDESVLPDGGEVVPCLMTVDQKEIVREAGHYTRSNWEHPLAKKFLSNVIEAMTARLVEGDFICLIGGSAHRQVAEAFWNQYQVVEFGIGYGGSFAQFRIFESSAWMHLTYGAEGGRNPNSAKASWWDDVIPNYFESERFPPGTGQGGYLGFLGRLNSDKGHYVASQVARVLGLEFWYAGPESGNPRPDYGTYLGELSGQDKIDFLGNAQVVLCPSQYIEPFCGVAVEAMLCGTPVVTSDFGAFRETISVGRSGFRARTFPEFVNGAIAAGRLDRQVVRQWALQFDCQLVAQRYETYFERLAGLAKGGWYGEFAAS